MKRFTLLLLTMGLLITACRDNESDGASGGTPVIHSIAPESGYPLSVLTIHGEHFSRLRVENYVEVNGIPARIIHFNENTIHVEVPEDGSTGEVLVRVGQLSVTGPVFEYLEPPALYEAETYAGTGTVGHADGDRLSALFNFPEGLDFDSHGNLYITDRVNHVVRKITPDGQVSTFAGILGSSGNNDGDIATARFFAPWKLAVGPDDNIYVADRSNHRIRKIDVAAGIVSTVAGSSSGFADGVGAAARFNRPLDVTVAADGTLYVADEQNDRIRKITTDGAVTTLAGGAAATHTDGIGGEARFNRPSGLDMTPDGNVVVTDRLNHCLRMVTPTGVTTTIAGTPGSGGFEDGSALQAKFNGLYGVCVTADGSMYIAEINPNHAIRRLTRTGELYTIGGNGQAGLVNGSPATTTRYRVPTDVAIDAAGRVYVADMENHVIRRLTRTN